MSSKFLLYLIVYPNIYSTCIPINKKYFVKINKINTSTLITLITLFPSNPKIYGTCFLQQNPHSFIFHHQCVNVGSLSSQSVCKYEIIIYNISLDMLEHHHHHQHKNVETTSSSTQSVVT